MENNTGKLFVGAHGRTVQIKLLLQVVLINVNGELIWKVSAVEEGG